VLLAFTILRMGRLAALAALSVVTVAMLAACTGVPAGLTPVSGFEVERYMGRWYEIARLDHSFERGLTNVTASYELQPDATVRVINRGFDPRICYYQERVGQARFTGPQDVASLAVTFFGPFAGGYHVMSWRRTTATPSCPVRHAAFSGCCREPPR
jgi:apolipoprotein D and lipocalin family protein